MYIYIYVCVCTYVYIYVLQNKGLQLNEKVRFSSHGK